MTDRARAKMMKGMHIRQAIREAINESEFNTHVASTTSWTMDEVIAGVIKYCNERPSMGEDYYPDVIKIAEEIVGKDRVWDRAGPYIDSAGTSCSTTSITVSFAVFIGTIAGNLFDI